MLRKNVLAPLSQKKNLNTPLIRPLKIVRCNVNGRRSGVRRQSIADLWAPKWPKLFWIKVAYRSVAMIPRYCVAEIRWFLYASIGGGQNRLEHVQLDAQIVLQRRAHTTGRNERSRPLQCRYFTVFFTYDNQSSIYYGRWRRGCWEVPPTTTLQSTGSVKCISRSLNVVETNSFFDNLKSLLITRFFLSSGFQRILIVPRQLHCYPKNNG